MGRRVAAADREWTKCQLDAIVVGRIVDVNVKIAAVGLNVLVPFDL